VTLDVHRAGKSIKIKVKPDAWPDELMLAGHRQTAPKSGAEDSTTMFGLKVQAITSQLAEQYGIDKTDGVIVTDVQRGRAAERGGIQPGDVITEVNHKPVSTLKQFRDALKAVDPKKGVIVNFTRRGTSKFEFLKESGD